MITPNNTWLYVGSLILVPLIVGYFSWSAARQRNNTEAVKNQADIEKGRDDGQIQYANSIMQFTDRKDAEINRLQVRVTTLEAEGAEKDRRIQVLSSENYDLNQRLAKMDAKITFLEDTIEGIREMIKRGILPGQNAGAVVGMAMGMATINPTTPQPKSTGTVGVTEEKASVDITAETTPPDASQPPKTLDTNGKTKQRKLPATPRDDVNADDVKADDGSDG